MSQEIKRLNYFTRQFLLEEDFDDEQAYHLDMRRRHNCLLHSWGVAGGLDVAKSADRQVEIEPGTAIDRDGRETVLLVSTTYDLTTEGTDTDVYLTIAYEEVFDETDRYVSGEVDDYTRTTERPVLADTTDEPDDDGSVILLAQITLDAEGNIGNVDTSVRKPAGGVVAPGSVDAGALANGAVTEDKLADGAVTEDKVADNAVTASKIRDGSVGILELADKAVTEDKLADGAVAELKIADGAVTEEKLAESVGSALSKWSSARDDIYYNEGNVGIGTRGPDHPLHVVGNAQIDADLTVKGSIEVGGTVGGRDVSADGAKLDTHVANGDNPHGTTAEDVKALPITGGEVTGTVAVQRTTGTPRAVLASWIESERYFGSLMECGLFIHGNNGGGICVGGMNLMNLIEGHTTFFGHVTFDGGKQGYVVERFINRSGVTLRTGDIVRLRGTPIVRFLGDLNKIPLPEVGLADKESDPAVIGIVDREAIPDFDEPDTRATREDPTSIPDGGELYVVTLGTYAHCKVDATEAPIQVGDLLTTSSNPGHAKKATEPKIGTIIGKALEPLAEGIGYIAVFANIQ